MSEAEKRKSGKPHSPEKNEEKYSIDDYGYKRVWEIAEELNLFNPVHLSSTIINLNLRPVGGVAKDVTMEPASEEALIDVFKTMVDTFGSRRSLGWLIRENKALGGEAPIQKMLSPEGCKEVKILLGQIGHGIAT